MRLTILGSGTLLPDPLRHSPAHWVETEEVRLLLDCGAGTVHGLGARGLPWEDLTHLVLSHLHTDHVGDVAALLWALRHGPGILGRPRSRPLTVVGPPGTRAFLERLSAAHGEHVLDPGFPLSIVEPGRDGVHEEPERGLLLRAAPTPHTERSVAWRVGLPGADLGYTGDTGPSGSLGSFLSGADVLITECSVSDAAGLDNHLSPASAAALARAARPRLLLLTHLYPSLDPVLLPDLLRDAGYEGWTATAWDGTLVEVAGDRVRILRSGAEGWVASPPAPPGHPRSTLPIRNQTPR